MKSTYVEFKKKGVAGYAVEDVSVENLGPLEVVIRNEASLISAGTELSNLYGTETGSGKYPCRSGYASVGRIIAKGDGVDDFSIGDRVFFAGKHALIQRFTHGQNHQWGRLYPVPENCDARDAVFVCLAQIAMIAPVLTPVHINDTAAVFGLGIIGNLCAQIYQIMGYRVIGLDPVEKRCEQARATGIKNALSVPAEKQVETVKAMTGGSGADVTVDAAGHSAVVKNCVLAAGLFGRVLLLGTPRLPVQGNLTEIFQDIHMRGIVVHGAHMWQIPAFDVRGFKTKETAAWAYRTIFDWMLEGRLSVTPLRSHVAPVEQAEEMYRGLQEQREEYWGVVFDWTKS